MFSSKSIDRMSISCKINTCKRDPVFFFTLSQGAIMTMSPAKKQTSVILSMNEKWLLTRIQQRGYMLPALVGAERFRLEDLDLICEQDGKIILTEEGSQYLQSL